MATKILYLEVIPDKAKMNQDLGIGDNFVVEPGVSMVPIIKEVAREDTEIDFQHVPRSAYMLDHDYLATLNNAVMIERIIEAEATGYDAAVVSCAFDPGLRAARQAVDIPVVFPGEASMLLACSMARKFGVITVQDELVPIMEDNIRNYGLRERSVPVRMVNLGENPLAALGGAMADPSSIIPEFEKVCKQSIADGAEIIIPACTAYAAALSIGGYREVPGTGVPVLDVNHAAIKQAETLVDFQRSVGYMKSQAGTYKSLPKETRDHMINLVKG